MMRLIFCLVIFAGCQTNSLNTYIPNINLLFDGYTGELYERPDWPTASGLTIINESIKYNQNIINYQGSFGFDYSRRRSSFRRKSHIMK